MKIESGIVLSKIRYSETSLIFQIFTQDTGTQSYLFPGGSRKNKKGNAVQPFQLVSFKTFGNNELKKISNIELIEAGTNKFNDPIKTCVTIFLAEILTKTIRFQERDDLLFNYLKQSIHIYDELNEIKYFPIWFLLNLTRYLGFFPNHVDQGKILDFVEGSFVNYRPAHSNFSSGDSAQKIKQLIGTKFDELNALNWSNFERNEVLKNLLEYYKCHIEETNQIKSLEVLETVFYS